MAKKKSCPHLLIYDPRTMEINHECSGLNFKERIRMNGLTQKQVAKRMRIDAGSLCLLLNGKRDWSEALARKLLKAVGAPGE